MVISNFQLGSVIDHPTENPCVGGSIPSLTTSRIKELRPLISGRFHSRLDPLTAISALGIDPLM